MATATGRSRCATCGKEKAILKCGGCTQDFCYNHFGDHRQQLNTQLEEVEVNRDLFRQTLIEQTAEPQIHPLIKQIDKWERDSITIIRQTAEEARQILLQHTTEHVKQIEVKLNKLTDQLRQGREENDFVETDLRQWTEQLTQLTNKLNRPSNISLRQDSKPFVTKLYVDIGAVPLYFTNIDANTRWAQNGVTVAGGNGRGIELNQLNSPYGIYIDDQMVYIADFSNHRIVEWKCGATRGQVVAGGNGEGQRLDQLSTPTDVIIDKKSDCLIICDYGNRRVVRWPRQNGTKGQTIIPNVNCWSLTMDNEGYLYVSDNNKHEVRRWQVGNTNGIVVAGGHGQGDRLDQLLSPRNICIDQDNSVYVSDYGNHRVMKWMKDATKGIVVAGGNGQGNGLTKLSNPNGVIIDILGNVYVADFTNHRVMRWSKEARQGSIVIGGTEKKEHSNQLNYPTSLSVDQQGSLYVVNHANDRVQKFNIDFT